MYSIIWYHDNSLLLLLKRQFCRKNHKTIHVTFMLLFMV